MGFLRRLFGTKKSGPPSYGSGSKPAKREHNRRWSFGSKRDKSLPPPPPSSALNQFVDHSSSLDANKHAIAVAAATAAVAEAALAAAHAAAEVVRLTSGAAGGSSVSSSSRPASSAARLGLQLLPEEIAAVKIQSAFRGYLSRRALRALKALVKLQALVRGHIVRKQSTDMLRRMQTLVRLQAQARASRAHMSDDSFKSSLSHYPLPEEYELPHRRAYSTKFDGSSILKRCSSNANYRNMELQRARFGSNWLDHWMEENVGSQTRNSLLRKGHPDDEKSDKILEVDTWKPHFNSHSHHCSSTSFQTAHYYLNSDYNNEKFMAHDPPSKRSTSKAPSQSLSSREVLPLSSLKFHKGKEEGVSSRTAENSPQAFSSSSRGGSGARIGPFSPAKSECSWGFFSGYMGHPNYMANTESSLAKVRSQSAPRQRLEFERYGSSRSSVQGLWEMGPSSDRDSDLRNRAFPATSRFNRVGSTNF